LSTAAETDSICTNAANPNTGSRIIAVTDGFGRRVGHFDAAIDDRSGDRNCRGAVRTGSPCGYI
jgi:hypothetical protein